MVSRWASHLKRTGEGGSVVFLYEISIGLSHASPESSSPEETALSPDGDLLKGFRHLRFHCAATVEEAEETTSQYMVWDSDHWLSSRRPQVIGVAVDLIESVRGQGPGVSSGDLENVHFCSRAPSNDSRIKAYCPS